MNWTGSVRTISEIFFRSTEHYSLDPFLSFGDSGKIIAYSSGRFRDSVLALAEFWLKSGLPQGSRIGIFSENRPEWHIADFGALLAGMIVVPVYPNLSPAQLKYVLSESGCSAVFVSGQERWTKLEAVLQELPDLRWVVGIGAGEESDLRPVAFAQIVRQVPDAVRVRQLRASALSVDPETIATIVYTSGTTGLPKGVMLSHSNVAFDLERCLRRLHFHRVDQALSVLPLSHVFERLLCYGYFYQGVPIAYGDPYELADLLNRYRPAAMGCVPRILEKIYEAVMRELDSLPAWKQPLSRGLLRAGISGVGIYNPASRRKIPSIAATLADLLLFSRVRRRLGGRVRYLICGGAPLDIQIEKFFWASRLPIIQGYGLTETTPVISLNDLDRAKLGTVGKPLEDVQVTFEEDGQLLTRGSHVMKGYYKDQELTRQAFREGWLYTGDLGRLDEDGYLVITGRKKELLVTAGGKNVSPMLVEGCLKSSPFIQEAFVVGDGRKFISALIVPNKDLIVRRLQQGGAEDADLLRSKAVLELLSAEVEHCQDELSEHEKVKKFCLLDESALQDPDLMTPTQKVRRGVLARKYRRQIDELYR